MTLSIALALPPNNGIGMPRDVSLYGWRIDRMIDAGLIVITVLFVIMMAWMLRACISHNSKHKADYDTGDSKNWRFAKLGIAAGIFLFIDGALFFNSVHDLDETIWNFKGALKDPAAIRIELNARQWNWQARYAGPDGKFNTPDDIVTLNDIRVPIDTPVVFQIAAVDVLHCLYIPNLRIKQDAVPGQITFAWLQATETGEFEIACAQHCGVNHYKMRGILTALTKEDYARWAADSSKNGERGYVADDKEAHWGWPWRDM